MLSPISRRLLLIGVRRASLSAQKLLVALDNKVLCPKRSTPSKALNFSSEDFQSALKGKMSVFFPQYSPTLRLDC